MKADILTIETAKRIAILEKENKRLLKKSYKDDVIITKVKEILETLKGSARWERHLYEVDYLLNIVNGGDADGSNE